MTQQQIGRTHHNTELQRLSATSKGSKESAFFSSTLIPVPVLQQLAARVVALGGGQLPMHMVLCHDVMVAVNGTEDQGDRRQGLRAAGLAVAEGVQTGAGCSKIPCRACTLAGHKLLSVLDLQTAH